MPDKIINFTDLNTWKESHKLVIITYSITKKFPKEELFCLTNQIRRAIISVTSNIAEWFARQWYKEKIQFYYLAQSSLTEYKNQIIISRDLNYITSKEFNDIMEQSNLSHKLLQWLITKSKKFLPSK